MSYRNDLEAAHARIAALEQEARERDGLISALGDTLEKAQITIVADRQYYESIEKRRRYNEKQQVTSQEGRIFASAQWAVVAALGIGAFRGQGTISMPLPELIQLMAMLFIVIYSISWVGASVRIYLKQRKANKQRGSDEKTRMPEV
jgi:hypothetical protein